MLTVQGKDKTRTYELNLALYGEVLVDKSKWNTLGRNIVLDITKKTTGPYWPRISKDEKKNNLIQVDWTRYADEDEEDTKKMDDIGGHNMEEPLPESDSDDEEEKKPEAKGILQSIADLNDLDKKEEKPKVEVKEPPKETRITLTSNPNREKGGSKERIILNQFNYLILMAMRLETSTFINDCVLMRYGVY